MAFRTALEVWTRDGTPGQWATTQQNPAGALWLLGERREDRKQLLLAREAMEAAREAYAELGCQPCSDGLAEVLRDIDASVARFE